MKFRAKPKGVKKGPARPAVHVRSDASSGGDSSDSDADSTASADSTVTSEFGGRFDGATLRQFISSYYSFTLESPPPKEWSGPDGTISSIMRELRLKSRCDSRLVKRVLERTWEAEQDGGVYDCSEQPGKGRKPAIAHGSLSQELVVTLDENGASLRAVRQQVNEARANESLEPVSTTAITTCMQRLAPEVSPPQHRQQGSLDPTAEWSKAGWGLCLQTNIRYGLMTDEEDIRKEINRHASVVGDEPLPDDEPLPAYFDPAELGYVDLQDVVVFDETHRKVVIGGAGHRGRAGAVKRKYRRDAESGALTTEPDAPVSTEERPIMDTKYEQEMRILAGFGFDPEGRGVAMEPLSYTGKRVPMLKEYEAEVRKEIERIQSLADGARASKEWIMGGRVPGAELFMDDPVGLLHGVGKEKQRSLEEAGFRNIGAIAAWDGKAPVDKLNSAFMGKLKAMALQATPGGFDGSRVEDYRKHENPYLARFGSEWEHEIAKSAALSSLMSPLRLMEHMVDEAVKLRGAGAMVYHDALIQLTDKHCVEAMKARGLYKRWFLPLGDLNLGTRFHGRPIGNHPEFSCCDADLFSVLHSVVARQIMATWRLDKDDSRKFDGSTPARLAQAYTRVLLAPGGMDPELIAHDLTKVATENFLTVMAANGTIVPGCGHRTGKRNARTSDHLETRGGKRTRVSLADSKKLWYHPDARSALDETVRDAATRLASRQDGPGN